MDPGRSMANRIDSSDSSPSRRRLVRATQIQVHQRYKFDRQMKVR